MNALLERPESMTQSETWTALLASLPAITLDDLCDEAALLRRVDRKYVVSDEQACEVVRMMAETGARILSIDGSREFRYLSDYYDTPHLALYHDAATGRRRRFKLRKRVYVDSGAEFLELKTRGPRSMNVKDRLERDSGAAGLCPVLSGSERPLYADADAFEWVSGRLLDRGVAADGPTALALIGRLAPVMRSTYRRSTLVTPGGTRVTMDSGLVLNALGAVAEEIGPRPADREPPAIPTIIETKSAEGISPVDRYLWRGGHRPARISKYALGIAQAYRVPANRWTRTMKNIGVAA